MDNFLAVSNLSWDGRPPGRGRPADEQWFSDIKGARLWLKEKLGSGGTISDGTRIVAWVPPGE